jgi:hypothetical protein
MSFKMYLTIHYSSAFTPMVTFDFHTFDFPAHLKFPKLMVKPTRVRIYSAFSLSSPCSHFSTDATFIATLATAPSTVRIGSLRNMIPKITIDPHWVVQTLIPYLRHAFSLTLRRNHDITPYVERALDFCKAKPVRSSFTSHPKAAC